MERLSRKRYREVGCSMGMSDLASCYPYTVARTEIALPLLSLGDAFSIGGVNRGVI